MIHVRSTLSRNVSVFIIFFFIFRIIRSDTDMIHDIYNIFVYILIACTIGSLNESSNILRYLFNTYSNKHAHRYTQKNHTQPHRSMWHLARQLDESSQYKMPNGTFYSYPQHDQLRTGSFISSFLFSNN